MKIIQEGQFVCFNKSLGIKALLADVVTSCILIYGTNCGYHSHCAVTRSPWWDLAQLDPRLDIKGSK